MSDATARSPAPQSASQLSENIGDVLASIRRLIAQDEATEAVAAAMARPMPSIPVPDAAEGPRHAFFPESASRRRDILAQAQALTRRSEAGFGQVAEAKMPLTLGAAERVTPGSTVLPGRAAAPVTDEIAGDAARPLVLTGPVAAAAPVGPPIAPVARAVEAGTIATAAPEAATVCNTIITGHSSPTAGTATTEGKAEDMNAPETLAPAMAASPAGLARASNAPALGVGGSQEAAIVTLLQPAASASPTAEPVLGAPSAAHHAPTPAMVAGTTTSASLPAAEAAGSAAQRPTPAAPASAPVIEDPAGEEEDCTATILRDMIREVVRQELAGDSAGLGAGDLRSMIMREVAQVLTKRGRGTR